MVMASSPEHIGREFVRQYYQLLHDAPEVLHRFFSRTSTFVHGGVDRPDRPSEEPAVGQTEIDKKIKSLNFKDCHTNIRQVDSQLTIGSGVVVQVTGELSNDGKPMRRFMQTFVLAPQTQKKFYVLNDIFRYQDEVYQDISDTESEDQEQNTENNLISKTASSLNINNYYQTESMQHEEPIGQQSTSSMSSSLQILASPTPAVELQKQQHMEQADQLGSEEQNNLLNGHSGQANNDVVLIQQEIKTSNAAVEVVVADELVLKEEILIGSTLAKEELDSTVEATLPLSKPTHNVWTQVVKKPAVKEQNITPAPLKPVVQKSQINTGINGNAPKPRDNKPRNNNSSSNQEPRSQPQNQTPREPRSVGGDDDKSSARYPDTHQVFVGNLSQDLLEPELRSFFNQFGKVVDMRVNTNSKQQSGRRLPNYGFLVFEERQAVVDLLAASKSNSITYKNEKGEYRLNVEEKHARQGRMSGSGFGGGSAGKGGSNSNSNPRVNNRSTSNSSRNGNGNNNNNNEQSKESRPKRNTNNNNNYSQSSNNNNGNQETSGSNEQRREGGFDRRKADVNDGQQIVESGSRRSNVNNPRRS